jgi:galactitol-specific phosphotransferase system IIB component
MRINLIFFLVHITKLANILNFWKRRVPIEKKKIGLAKYLLNSSTSNLEKKIRAILGHGAGSSAQVVVGLDEVLQASHNQVVVVAAAVHSVRKVPRAYIPVFIIIGVVPSSYQRISYSFNDFVSNGADSRIDRCIAVWRSTLGEAITAGGRDSNPSIFIISIVVVPSTVVGAKSSLGHIAF